MFFLSCNYSVSIYFFTLFVFNSPLKICKIRNIIVDKKISPWIVYIYLAFIKKVLKVSIYIYIYTYIYVYIYVSIYICIIHINKFMFISQYITWSTQIYGALLPPTPPRWRLRGGGGVRGGLGDQILSSRWAWILTDFNWGNAN